MELEPFHHRRAVSATDLDPSMPDRTRISTRTWAGILVTHGVYYENSCYPVVLGLEGSVKTWPRKWVTPVSLEIETKKSTAPLPFPPSLVLISPALSMARLSSLAHTKYTDTNAHIHYPRVVRPVRTTSLWAANLAYTRTLRSRYLREYSYSSLATRQFVRPDLARQLASTHPDADTRSSPVQLVQGWLQTGP
ncbi:hypothetical protein N5P37_004128 [Trichoderma harzianum]|nr:hypothetical protein N5P37_004128 [Trichoderma harzianum]